jgi:HEPN domain-containing protein
MKPVTREWVEKADGDFATASRELRALRQPNHDAVCFHAQQCIEKYLKARLVEENTRFPKTHDLGLLLDLILSHEPLWDAFRPMLTELSDFAVSYSSPGKSATRKVAKIAFDNCQIVRKVIRSSLGPGKS